MAELKAVWGGYVTAVLTAVLFLSTAGCGGEAAGTDSAPTTAARTTAGTAVTTTIGLTQTTETADPATAAVTTKRQTTPKSKKPTAASSTAARPSPTAGPSSTARPTTTSTKAGPRPTLPEPQGGEAINSLTDKNQGPMGDWGAPAYCVYSKKGYNRVSMDVKLSDVQVNMTRQSDQKTLVGYIFLGMDIWDADTGVWVNCLDAGLKYGGDTKTWNLFHLIYDVSVPNQNKWYTSGKNLDPTHDYRLSLDCSKMNGWVTLAAYDLTEGREADSVLFQARHALKDGKNVSFYQDYAIDFPENVKMDTEGKPTDDEFVSSIYNTDEGIYLRNVKILNARLNDQLWTKDKTRNRAASPDSTKPEIGYPVVRVSRANFDYELQIDIDMNR